MNYLIKSIFLFAIFGLFQTSIAQSSLNYGARSKGMAGSGTALVENSLAGNMNPGGQVFLGQKISIGMDISMFNNSYTIIGNPTQFDMDEAEPWPFGLVPGYMEAEQKINFVPHISYNTKINEKSAFSINVYGNGNRGVEYNTKTYYSQHIADFGSGEGFVNPMGTVTEPTFFKYSQYFAAATYSRQFGDKLGIGISIIGAWQSMSIGGLSAFGTLDYASDKDHLSDNNADNSFGVGGKLGLQWNISEKFNAGVSFRSKIYMSPFESYQGLIAESGKIDLPSEWSIGLMYNPFYRFQMMLDVNRICYSGVPAWGLAMEQNNAVQLGGENGGGFGRKDQMNYKLGLQYSIPNWQFRLGYQYSELALVESEALLNMMMPDVMTDYLTLGISRQIGKQSLHFSVIKGMENTWAGINGLDNAQEIELSSDMWNFEIAVEF